MLQRQTPIVCCLCSLCGQHALLATIHIRIMVRHGACYLNYDLRRSEQSNLLVFGPVNMSLPHKRHSIICLSLCSKTAPLSRLLMRLRRRFAHCVVTVCSKCADLLWTVLFLGAFAKLRMATVSFVMFCRPSVRPSAWNLAPTGRIFMKSDIWIH
jgi:hypothetical protein